MIKNLSVKHKFTIILALILCFSAILAWGMMATLSPLGASFDGYVDENQRRNELMSKIEAEFGYGGAIHNFKNYVLRGKPKHAVRMREARNNIIASLDALAMMKDITQVEKTALVDIRGVIDAYGGNLSMVEKMVAEGATPAQIDAVVKISDKPALQGLKQLRAATEEKLVVTKQDFAQLIESSTSRVMLVLGVMLVLAATVLMIFRWSVLTPLGHLVSAVNNLARGEGDLRRRLPVAGKDEFAVVSAGFNGFLDQVQGIVQQVSTVSKELVDSTEEMSGASVQARDSIASQRSELRAVLSAMNAMASSVHEVARDAEEAATSASEVDRDADASKQVVAANVEVINSVATAVQQAGEVLARLERDSEGIGSVLDVIRGIAEQTNLLALNAAIEAARAGDQGRGFAVVADEVRTLAQRTQESTAEIQRMIEGLQQASAEAVRVMAQGQTRVGEGVQEAGRVSESLAQMAEGIDNMRRLNTQIAVSAEQQSQVASEVDQNLTNVNQLMDAASQSAENVARVSENLKQVSQSMQERVAGYQA